MPLKQVEYDAKVRLVYEVVYEEPDQFGMRPTYRDQEEMWDDDDDRLDEEKLAAGCPDAAWGWFTQQRFDSRIVHNGTEVQLTSLPSQRSGTTFLNGRIVGIDEITSLIEDQRRYAERQEALGEPVGALPHGSDKRPLLIAIQQGEEILQTRNGHYRAFDRKRGDSICMSEEPV